MSAEGDKLFKSDVLFQSTDSVDIDRPKLSVDTRLRLGYPRLTAQGSTETDATIARNAAKGIPAANMPAHSGDVTTAPALTDTLADVKRALMFTPHTGASLTSGGSFSAYLGSNFDVRVLDGAMLVQAVDQDFPDPADSTKSKPGLSYLRVGKPEPKLLDSDGKPLGRDSDPLQDEKYKPGIGLYTDGELNVWSRGGDINLTTNRSYNVTSDEKAIEVVGESYEVTYEYPNEEDEKKVKEGKAKPLEVERKIVAVDMKRKGVTGWYKQEFKRGLSLDFSAANKGEVSFSSSYGVSMGAKIDHGLSLGFETSVSGKIELSKSWGIEIGEHGAIYKGTAGRWTQENQRNIAANEKITIKVDPLGALPFETAAKVYKVVAYAANAAQMAVMLAYNAALLDSSLGKLSPAAAGEAEPDNKHDLRTRLDAGIHMYESCALASALTAAAGAVLAAVQARNLQVPIPNPTAAKIVVTTSGIRLQCGTSSITLTSSGIKLSGPTIESNGSMVTTAAAVVNHYNQAMGIDDMIVGSLFD